MGKAQDALREHIRTTRLWAGMHSTLYSEHPQSQVPSAAGRFEPRLDGRAS